MLGRLDLLGDEGGQHPDSDKPSLEQLEEACMDDLDPAELPIARSLIPTWPPRLRGLA